MVALLPSLPSTIALLDGRYQLLTQLGEGSFSRVFQAIQPPSSELVAVKRLRQTGLPTTMRGSARQAFRREARVLAYLSHRQIPRLYEASFDGGLWYIVLEYINGETLENYLKRQPGLLPLQEIINLGLQICNVLEYLHHHFIKFRDLKPANIMRKPDGQITLIDFGLACPFQPGWLDATTSGTPGYAAPEQYPNEWGQGASTLQSDIYSLGVVLHQLLTGKHPQKKTRPEVFTFSPLMEKTPSGLAALVTSMLKCKPEERISTIQEVQALLKNFLTTNN